MYKWIFPAYLLLGWSAAYSAIGFNNDTFCAGILCPAAPASPYNANGTVLIGVNTIGSLNISGGSIVTNTNGVIAFNASSTSSVIIKDTNSLWSKNGNLVVGNNGNGSLTIQDGATVSNDTGEIAGAINSESTVVITGINSKWTNSGSLIIGRLGQELLNVNSGGLLSVGGVTILADSNNSLGTLNLSSGGVLKTQQLLAGSGTSQANFDGGVLQAVSNQANLITGFSAGELNLLTNGLIIDSNGFNVRTEAVFLEQAA